MEYTPSTRTRLYANSISPIVSFRWVRSLCGSLSRLLLFDLANSPDWLQIERNQNQRNCQVPGELSASSTAIKEMATLIACDNCASESVSNQLL